MLMALFRETEIFCRTFELMARSLHAIGKSLPQLAISPKSTFGKKFLMSRSTMPFAWGGWDHARSACGSPAQTTFLVF